MRRSLIVAVVAALSVSVLPAGARRVELAPVHVCIEQPDGSRDTWTFLSAERPTEMPSPALMRSVTNTLAYSASKRKSPDLMLAATSVRFIAPKPVWFKPRRLQPIWDDGSPAGPPAGYDCSCASPTFTTAGKLAACVVGECNGCYICVAR